MLSLSLAALLAATAERLHVEWIAPEGCPSRDALAASLETSVPPSRTFHASVRIDEPARGSDSWRAVVITTADASQHTRVVQGADCERVTDAAVLVVTLAATQLPPGPEAPPISHQVTQPPPSDAELNGQGGSDSPPEPLDFHVRVQPLVSGHAGVLPTPGVSWGISLALMVRRLRVQLALSDWVALTVSTNRNVRAGLISVALRGCWLFQPHEVVRLGPCAALDAGRLSVEAGGLTAPAPGSIFWSSVFAGVTAGFQLTKSISPWVTAEVGPNLVRPRFYVLTRAGDQTVHSVGWVVARLTLGIELELSLP